MIGSWMEGDIWDSGTCRSIYISMLAYHWDLTDLGICVTKFDGNISFQLVLESNGSDSRNGSDCGRLSVGDMTNGTNIDLLHELYPIERKPPAYGSLTGDNLWAQGVELATVDISDLLGDTSRGFGRSRCGIVYCS